MLCCADSLLSVTITCISSFGTGRGMGCVACNDDLATQVKSTHLYVHQSIIHVLSHVCHTQQALDNEALTEVRAFVESYRSLPTNPPVPHIVFSGSAGAGKTFTAQHAIRELSDKSIIDMSLADKPLDFTLSWWVLHAQHVVNVGGHGIWTCGLLLAVWHDGAVLLLCILPTAHGAR